MGEDLVKCYGYVQCGKRGESPARIRGQRTWVQIIEDC